jgi:hypothetical protein
VTNLIFGSFLVLHGFVHLLYFGQSIRAFELQPGMTWPMDSWLFSKHFSRSVLRVIAATLCVLAGMGFLIGGVGLLFAQTWAATMIIAAAILSIVLYVLFWDGRRKHLDRQGGIGVLIDVAVLAAGMVIT